jgi:hypothetical protein
MAHSLPIVAGLLMLAGAQASDVADRSIHNGFLSQYMGSGASKTSMGDYNQFVTPQFSRMKHGGADADALHHHGLAEHGPAKDVIFDKSSHPTAPTQDSQVEEEKSVQKLLTNDNSMPFGMSAIAVSLLTLAAMLGIRVRRGLQQATDVSIALAPASADNILELKAQESIVRGQVGWSQQSSENSHPLTVCGAYDPTDFTDVQTLPGILEPTGFFDPAGLSDGVSPSELKRFRETNSWSGRIVRGITWKTSCISKKFVI